jgi:hypothetical protein
MRNVSTATPRAVAHSAWDKPSRPRISLRTEAYLVIDHDDAIGPVSVGSEWIAMRIRGSQPLRNGPETAKSISVGRFRPVAVSRGIVAEFRGPVSDSANSGQIGAPGRGRTCDPRLRRPMLYPLSYGRVRNMSMVPPRLAQNWPLFRSPNLTPPEASEHRTRRISGPMSGSSDPRSAPVRRAVDRRGRGDGAGAWRLGGHARGRY